MRHPQYLGLILIMVGFLLQWPTFATLAMFPILLLVDRRLAIREEREVKEQLGAAWVRYASVTPRFLPRLHPSPPPVPGSIGAPSPEGRPRNDARPAPGRARQRLRRDAICTVLTVDVR